LFDPAAIDRVARRLLQHLPAGIADMDADLRRNVRAALTQALRDMDLVTREEYELQTRVLARTREKLEQLEQRASDLERRLAGSRVSDPD
jgi:BMFP domain-containing protein YqiC